MKITFASGRVQVFNRQPLPSESKTEAAAPAQKVVTSPEERHKKVAILPFTFVSDGQSTDESISEHVQNECYSFMNKHAGHVNRF